MLGASITRRRLRRVIAAFLVASPMCIADPEALSSPSQLRWSHRLVLLSPSLATDAALAALRKNAGAIGERHLLWFLLTDSTLETNYDGPVATRFTASVRDVLDGGNVVLIGKDGGVKLRADSLDLPAIFARIDAMPMRRREMTRER